MFLQKFYEEMRRFYHTTPTSYMEFVRLFLGKLHEKRTELTFNCDRLTTGLQKLADSNELVGAMQVELLQLGPKLGQKTKVMNGNSSFCLTSVKSCNMLD